MSLRELQIYIECRAGCNSRSCEDCYNMYDCNNCPIDEFCDRDKCDEILKDVAEILHQQVLRDGGERQVSAEEIADIFSQFAN